MRTKGTKKLNREKKDQEKMIKGEENVEPIK